MDSQAIPLLTDILPMYEGIYPPETIEAVYNALKVRIETLQPIVEANEGRPLVTAIERESYEPGQGTREIALRSQNNEATRKELEDCQAAWERLINGTAHICTGCGRTIDKDRKQAKPAADKCKECHERIGLRVH